MMPWVVVGLTLLVLLFCVRNAQKREKESDEWLASERTLEMVEKMLTHEWVFMYKYVCQFKEKPDEWVLRLARLDPEGIDEISVAVSAKDPGFQALQSLSRGMQVYFAPTILRDGYDPLDPASYVEICLENERVMDR